MKVEGGSVETFVVNAPLRRDSFPKVLLLRHVVSHQLICLLWNACFIEGLILTIPLEVKIIYVTQYQNMFLLNGYTYSITRCFSQELHKYQDLRM